MFPQFHYAEKDSFENLFMGYKDYITENKLYFTEMDFISHK